ncbi:MAG: PEP-CTERM sorting domain-containing protein [Pseudomonadota bacterium]
MRRLISRARAWMMGALGAGLLLSSVSAPAGIVIDIQEVGNDVVASTTGGFLDVTALTQFANDAVLASNIGPGAIPLPPPFPSIGATVILGDDSTTADAYVGVGAFGPTTFGFGVQEPSDVSTGDLVGLNYLPGSNATLIVVPNDFAGSGTIGPASATWFGETLASLGDNPLLPGTLGALPGTYVYSWGAGSDAEMITLNVIAQVSEPSTMLLMMSVALMGLMRLRRQNA